MDFNGFVILSLVFISLLYGFELKTYLGVDCAQFVKPCVISLSGIVSGVCARERFKNVV